MTSYQHLLLATPAPHVRLITLNRPAAANAFNTKLAQEIAAAVGEAAAGGGDIRCVLITGAGTRAFCAGADLKERDGMSDEAWRAQHGVFEAMFMALMQSPLPVIAVVNGAAFGGGCEIALACDFIYAARTARFALTETTLGFIPGGAATQNLPRAVGLPRAKEIILSGQPFSAQEAADWGMVNHLFDPEDLIEPAVALAGRIARNGPLAVRAAKLALNRAIGPEMRIAYAAELEAYDSLVPTEDRREGVRAFAEKRSPVFKGK